LAEAKKGPLAARPEILLIEDDPQIRKVLKAILVAEDYRLYEATTANDGVAQAASRNPDLILLDLGLPDRDGIEVIREIRNWSQLPILILSARDREKGSGRSSMERTTVKREVAAPMHNAMTTIAMIENPGVRLRKPI